MPPDVLLELDGERARVIYAWNDEAGSQGLIETWLPTRYVTAEESRSPSGANTPPSEERDGHRNNK